MMDPLLVYLQSLQSFLKRNGGEIHQVCAACGYQGTINIASHKLTTYIAKNPPDAVRLPYRSYSLLIFRVTGIKKWNSPRNKSQR
jgi:hypothetical protein